MDRQELAPRQTAGEGAVSVVIPTYNRAERLECVLQSYLRQRCVTEVIVVDDASTDRTPRMLGMLSKSEPRLRHIRLAVNGGQAGACAAGVAAAREEFVFFGEDDYEATPDQVATLLEHMQRCGADLIAGRRINVFPEESYEHALRRVGSYDDPLIESWAIMQNPHVDTGTDVEAPLLDACALVRRQVFQSVAFDPGFKANGWREETDFQLGCLEAGFRLVHCPHAVGFHSPGSPFKFRGGSRSRTQLNYERWVLRNNLRLLRKHWRFLRSKRSGLRVPPLLALALLVQTVLRSVRGVKKLSRFAVNRVASPPTTPQGHSRRTPRSEGVNQESGRSSRNNAIGPAMEGAEESVVRERA